MDKEKTESLNFLETIVEAELQDGLTELHTRFPPEPNGYLHIGHAKSICVNFGLAEKYGGKTNLRFDDTNPVAEDTEFVESIQNDIRWLGFDWEDREFYASDYFEQLYQFALRLVEKGLAYVDESTPESIAEHKGSPTVPGTPTPARSRSVAENRDLFQRMRAGEFPDGAMVLRAKIDLASPNMHLRDPIMYRILHAHHHRTGDAWKIYPMYDFAHGQSDSIEQISHSICTLEFENHRPLYNWFIEQLGIFPSRQFEFARLNLSYTVMSKRRLKQLVTEGLVRGWDDPRMPTLSGLRRRGYTPVSIRNFAKRVGVARRENVIDLSLLEFSVREDLNKVASRVMGVLDPVKLVITNYPEAQTEQLAIENNPEDPDAGHREVPFTRELYIERADFMEDPPKKFFRLGPGRNVRLKGAYIIHCEDYVKDESGLVTEIHGTYYPDSRSGSDTSGVKAKGTLHWVSVPTALPVEVRLYDRLFSAEFPLADPERDFKTFLNPDSLQIVKTAYVEPSLRSATTEDHFQFIRKGYFCLDPDSTADQLVFNRTVGLRDSWAKKQNKR
ncbi:MAG: glutamine--tRNA ligase/YqeY domain fusion protein [Bacteroidota bacterium]